MPRRITFRGRWYKTAYINSGPQRGDLAAFRLPPGHYFTLGDNRDNSQDSRSLKQAGYIPEENFIGPAAFRFWNNRGLSLGDRPEEIYPPTEQ